MMSSRIIKRNSKLDAIRIFQAAVEAVLPNNMVNLLLSKNSEGMVIGKTFYPLKSKRISLVGFGKAVLGMANAVENVLGEDLHSGILSVPLDTLETINNSRKNDLIPGVQKIKIYEGARNNLPDKNAFIAAEEIMKFVEHLDKNDLLLVLISGGGSALLPVPIPPITLEEKCHVTQLLSNRGANIRELNTVRKELSAVKGGKLALAAAPAKVVSLILSDVIGDELDLIASGPTVPPCSNWKDAMTIIDKYNVKDHVPLSILDILAHQPEEPSLKTSYEHVENFLIGSNATALQAAKNTAEKMGYSVCQLSTQVCGEAKSFAQLVVQIAWFMVKTFHGGDTENATNKLLERFVKHGIHAEKLKELQLLAQTQNQIAILSGGETVVQVVGTGYGGRNQETALACSLALRQTFKSDDTALKKLDITFLSAGTDGQDGPTTAAGAFAYLGQLDDLSNENCCIQSFLSNNDSNSFYKQFKSDDLVITGVTGTNVMDVHILLIVFDMQH